jgi:serine/threonine protein kinase
MCGLSRSADITSFNTCLQMNILVDSACCPRLADFGLVRLDDLVTAGGFTHTTNGFDFRWTSPQRLNEEVRGPSDDVYSFGCVGYYGVRDEHDGSCTRVASPLKALRKAGR